MLEERRNGYRGTEGGTDTDTTEEQRNGGSVNRGTVCQQSIKFLGPKIWNKLPTIIKESKSLRSFARKAKAHLISN